MIEYEIQLWYVIRDKIQSHTKFSPRQISVQEKILSEKKFDGKKILRFCL